MRMSNSGDKTSIFPSVRKARGKSPALRYLLWSTLVAALLVASMLRWGGYLLISDDPLPPHVDGAVVLQGSVLGENARVAGAVRVLRQGTAPTILISVPKESYWGQPVAPNVSTYVEKLYGHEAADHIDFCGTEDVDSTEEEARTLARCINQRGWHSIAIVTSDYHTRRAGIIWRKVLRQQHSSVNLWIHAVPDPEFHPSGWWRKRRFAKTWVLEFTKLLWTLAGG
jgi:uncharacterized SAM-binding protein YcdF (DUF218 family)